MSSKHLKLKIVIFLCLSAGLWNIFRPRYIIGKVTRVIDGDTIKVTDQKIRLLGIDAPESDQKNSQNVNIGKISKLELEKKILNKVVRIKIFGEGFYKRKLGRVFLLNRDINYWMVNNGFAIPSKKAPTQYVVSSYRARLLRKGLFKHGIWLHPRFYRKSIIKP